MKILKVTILDGSTVEAHTFDFIAQIYKSGRWQTVAVNSDYNEVEKKRKEYAVKGCYTRIEQLN